MSRKSVASLADPSVETTDEPSRETLDRQLAQRLRDLQLEYPKGIPGGLIPGLIRDFKLGSRATFYRRQAAILGSDDPCSGTRKLRKNTFVITEEMHEHFAPSLTPTLDELHKRLKKHFPNANVPEYPHFTRVIKRYIDTDWYRKVRLGVDKGLAAQAELLVRSSKPGQVWHFDAKNLRAPINASDSGAIKPVDGWVISVWDHNTRKYLAQLFVLGVVTSEHVMCVLAMAIRNAGGIAHMIICDNASENIARLADTWVRRCNSKIVTINSGHKNENAVAESPHRVIERLSMTLPGYTRGPRDLNDALPLPRNGKIATASWVKAQLAQLRDEYDNSINRMMGTTPLQAWLEAEDAGELHLYAVDPAYLASAAMRDPYKRGTPAGSKVIADIGVQFTVAGDPWHYWCEYFQGKVHVPGQRGNPRRVYLRYWPDDPTEVEVFDLAWRWRGTAEYDPNGDIRRGNAARNASIDRDVRGHLQHAADTTPAATANNTTHRTEKKVSNKRTPKRGADSTVVADSGPAANVQDSSRHLHPVPDPTTTPPSASVRTTRGAAMRAAKQPQTPRQPGPPETS